LIPAAFETVKNLRSCRRAWSPLGGRRRGACSR
jgi:hypothetical protein